MTEGEEEKGEREEEKNDEIEEESKSFKSTSSADWFKGNKSTGKGMTITAGRPIRGKSHPPQRGKKRDSWGKKKFSSSSFNSFSIENHQNPRKSASQKVMLRCARWKRKNSHELAWVKIVEADRLHKEM